MSNVVLTLKEEYNKVIARWNKATAYLENPERTTAEIDAWVPEYKSILKQRLVLCKDIAELSGIRPTLDEFENGFKEVRCLCLK